MEHEIEKMIREKVRGVEEQPASWQKQRVWQMIRAEKVPASHRPTYYYVAASIVIILSVIFYRIQLENQKQLALKIASLESEIDNQSKSEDQDHSLFKGFKTDEPICMGQPTQPSTAKREVRGRTLINDLPEIIPVVKEDPLEIAKVAISDDAPSESVEKTQEATPVRAIIGFIPKPSEVTHTSKVKKSKFRLFRNRNEEFNAPMQEENKLLTARIN